MKLTVTGRGFSIVHFLDRYGQICSLQQSSSVSPGIWLGSDDPPQVDHVTGLTLGNRMLLDVGHVKELLPLLQNFADTGYLKEGATKADLDYDMLKAELEDTRRSAGRLAEALRELNNNLGEITEVSKVFESVYSDIASFGGLGENENG